MLGRTNVIKKPIFPPPCPVRAYISKAPKKFPIVLTAKELIASHHILIHCPLSLATETQ
jgi:hypothetical protein